jgi:VanZ family protein
MSNTSVKLISVAVLALMVFAALGPANWVPRSGLGWQIDHIVGYSVFTWMCCLAWPRPIVVGGALMAFAIMLEALQAFTPDRHPDLDAALYSADAVLAAALVAEFFMRAPRLLTRRMLLTVQSALVRGVAAQSPASGGLIAQPIPVRLKTGPLLSETHSGRSGITVLGDE